MIKCPDCGHDNADTNNFCANCGHSLAGLESAATPPGSQPRSTRP